MTVDVAAGKNRSYHHGDLKTALLDRSLEILECEGIEGLSLRAVARRAGVSQAAPYGHFRDKQALLAAVAAVGFRRLTAQLSDRGAGASDSGGRIAALGRGYVEFATENPALFRLMFGRQLSSRFAEDGDLQTAASAAFAVISDAVSTHLGAIGGREDPLLATQTAWALVHGLSYLIIEHMLGEQCEVDTDGLVERATRILVAGLS